MFHIVISPALDEEGEVDGVIEIGVDVARGGLTAPCLLFRSGTQTLRIERLIWAQHDGSGWNPVESAKNKLKNFMGCP